MCDCPSRPVSANAKTLNNLKNRSASVSAYGFLQREAWVKMIIGYHDEDMGMRLLSHAAKDGSNESSVEADLVRLRPLLDSLSGLMLDHHDPC